jgi:hypothetical protein
LWVSVAATSRSMPTARARGDAIEQGEPSPRPCHVCHDERDLAPVGRSADRTVRLRRSPVGDGDDAAITMIDVREAVQLAGRASGWHVKKRR